MTSGALYHLVTTCLVSYFYFPLTSFPLGTVKFFRNIGFLSSYFWSSIITFESSFLAVKLRLGLFFFEGDITSAYRFGDSIFDSSSHFIGHCEEEILTSFRLLDSPKSHICIVQSSFTRIFSGLRSLWQIFAEWR